MKTYVKVNYAHKVNPEDFDGVQVLVRYNQYYQVTNLHPENSCKLLCFSKILNLFVKFYFQPDDVLKELSEWLQPGYFTSSDDFIASLAKETSFKPHGHKLHSYKRHDG